MTSQQEITTKTPAQRLVEHLKNSSKFMSRFDVKFDFGEVGKTTVYFRNRNNKS